MIEDDDESVDRVIEQFASITTEPTVKRDVCDNCERPLTVCWCPYLTQTPIETKSNLMILQHPSEEKRCLRTAKILELSLSSGRCHIIRGKKFTSYKHPELSNALSKSEDSLLLYPGNGSISINSLPSGKCYNILIIDGTWQQSRSIYHNSTEIHKLPKVELNCDTRSNYVIRTQPNDLCLSTVETAAIALAHVENDSSIYDKLTAPLKALCDFQLKHGAVEHQSKEHLILSGLYNKPLTKRIKQKLFKNEDIKHFIR